MYCSGMASNLNSNLNKSAIKYENTTANMSAKNMMLALLIQDLKLR
jgi:hypothetical protein